MTRDLANEMKAAGGGKGAALGALAEGVGGFIYDRKTNDRK